MRAFSSVEDTTHENSEAAEAYPMRIEYQAELLAMYEVRLIVILLRSHTLLSVIY